MRHLLLSVRFSTRLCALGAVLALGAGSATAQVAKQESLRGAPPDRDLQTVLSTEDVGETLRVAVGHSRLMTGKEPFGTIIVGDDTIASASPGPGDTIILTGLAAGSTNLIVLDESQETVVSAVVAVEPVAGPLRSTVTVMKGSETRETYECRGQNCQRMASDEEQRERPLLLVAAPDEAPAQAGAGE